MRASAFVFAFAVGSVGVAQEGGSGQGGEAPPSGTEALEGLDARGGERALEALEEDIQQSGEEADKEDENPADERMPGFGRSPRGFPIFGMNLFTRKGRLRDPLMPVSSDYILGPGDTLVVHFWNDQIDSRRLRLSISRDGTISLPEKVGEVVLSGLTFVEAERLIEAGRVAVDGRRIASPALDITPDQAVTVDGKPLPTPEADQLLRRFLELCFEG